MYHNAQEGKAKNDLEEKGQNTEACEEVKNVGKSVKNQTVNDGNVNKQTILSKTNIDLKQTSINNLVLPLIINDRIKENENQSDTHLNKQLNVQYSSDNQSQVPEKKNVDVGISPDIPSQVLDGKMSKAHFKAIKRGPNFSMDNVTLYAMLSKQTRDLYNIIKVASEA